MADPVSNHESYDHSNKPEASHNSDHCAHTREYSYPYPAGADTIPRSSAPLHISGRAPYEFNITKHTAARNAADPALLNLAAQQVQMVDDPTGDLPLTETNDIHSATSLGCNENYTENYTFGSPWHTWQTSVSKSLAHAFSSLGLDDVHDGAMNEEETYKMILESPIESLSSYEALAAEKLHEPRQIKTMNREYADLQEHKDAAGLESQSQEQTLDVEKAVSLIKDKHAAGSHFSLAAIQESARAKKTNSSFVTEFTRREGIDEMQAAGSDSAQNITLQRFRPYRRSKCRRTAPGEMSDWLLGVGDWVSRDLRVLELLSLAPNTLPVPLKSLVQSQDGKRAPGGAIAQCAGGGSTQPRRSSNPPYHSRSRGQGRSRKGGKRTARDSGRHSDEAGEDDENDDGDKRDAKRSKNDPPQSPKTAKWYACPFNKHDPNYFSTNEATKKEFKLCESRGWEKINLLKEHLYRKHLDPPRCDRCQEAFKRQEELGEHRRQLVGCDLKPKVQSKAISPQILAELKRRPTSSLSDDEKWFEIWNLLFPGEGPPPSPYSDPHAHGFLECLEDRMPFLLGTKLTASLGGLGLTFDQQRQVRDIAVELESSLRQEIWDLYQSGERADNGFPSDDGEKDSPQDNTSFENQPEGPQLGLTLFDGFFASESAPPASAHGFMEEMSYQPYQFSQHQDPRNPLPAPPSAESQPAYLPTQETHLLYNGQSGDSGYADSLPNSTSGDSKCIDPAQIMATKKPQGHQSQIPTTRSPTIATSFDDPQATNSQQDAALTPFYPDSFGISDPATQPDLSKRDTSTFSSGFWYPQ